MAKICSLAKEIEQNVCNVNTATASYSLSETVQEYIDEPESQCFTKTQQIDEYRKKNGKVTGMSSTYNPSPSIILAIFFFFNDVKHGSIQPMLHDP